MQIVDVKAGSGYTVVSNIYRSLSNSIAEFLTVLAEFLTTVRIEAGDRLVLCGNFNMSCLDSKSIDVDLSALLDMHSQCQYVNLPTNRDLCTGKDRENILDLLVMMSTSTIVLDIKVENSFHLSLTIR